MGICLAVYKLAYKQSRSEMMKGDGDFQSVAIKSIAGIAAGVLLFFAVQALGMLVCAYVSMSRTGAFE